MRALLLIEVKSLAVVAADALALHDLRPANRAPLAGLLADLARSALAPSLDAEDGERRQDAQRRPDRAEEPAVQVADEHGRNQQHAEADPHAGGAEQPEHPERLSVADRRRDVLRDQVVDHHGRKDAVLDPCGALFDGVRQLDAHPRRHDRVQQLRQRAERADTPAVQAAPQHRGHDDEECKEVPGEAVLERRQAQIGETEDVADRHEAALHEPHVADGRTEGDVFQAHALAEEADHRERDERREQRQIERLGAEDLSPGFRAAHYFVTSGGSSCLATIRDASRIARVALPMLIDARDTASTSPPTRNGSAIFLPLNCAANFGGSTEKYPYGSES